MADRRVEEDDVFVKIKSKRGSSTRDQDEVVVTATYESIEKAEAESGRLNVLARERLSEAREVSFSDESTESSQMADKEETDDDEETKIYLGNGSQLIRPFVSSYRRGGTIWTFQAVEHPV